MGKKHRASGDGAQRSAPQPGGASGAAASRSPEQARPAAAPSASPAAEAAPLHDVARISGSGAAGAHSEELLVTVHLPGVQNASEVSALVIRPDRISLRVPGRYRLELPLVTPVQETPLSVKLHKKEGVLKIHLAVQHAAAARPGSGSPRAAPGAAPPSPGAEPATSRSEADALAAEAMQAVQAEDIGKAARLMGKAARLAPSEYGEAFELIEAARRSVGAEQEPDSPGPSAPPAATSPAAGAGASPAASSPASGGGRKAGRGGKGSRGRTMSPDKKATPPPAEASTAAAASAAAAASPPPRGSAPVANGAPHAHEASEAAAADVAAEAAEEEGLPNWSWSMLASALWTVWLTAVATYAPLVPDALGWTAGEDFLRQSLRQGSSSRNVVGAAAAAAMLLLLLAAGALSLALARVALGAATAGLAASWHFSLAMLRAVAWEPVWYAVFPAAIAAAVQSRSALANRFWIAPIWWWLLGGRTWGLLGSLLAVVQLGLFGAPPYWLAVLAITLLRWACLIPALWLRIPVCLVIFAAWAFCFLLFLHLLASAAGAAGEAPPGELPTEVPPDAQGEVARILGCRHYYAVLELDDTADEETVRKAHRRKALLVHPDKCATPHAQLAFQRVQDAFELLKDKRTKCEYDDLLAQAAYAREHGTRPEPAPQQRDPWADDAARGGPRAARHRARKGKR